MYQQAGTTESEPPLKRAPLSYRGAKACELIIFAIYNLWNPQLLTSVTGATDLGYPRRIAYWITRVIPKRLTMFMSTCHKIWVFKEKGAPGLQGRNFAFAWEIFKNWSLNSSSWSLKWPCKGIIVVVKCSSIVKFLVMSPRFRFWSTGTAFDWHNTDQTPCLILPKNCIWHRFSKV